VQQLGWGSGAYGDHQGERERDPNKGRLLRQLVNELQPRLVAFSSWWTVDRPREWHPHTIQSEFARDACVYLLAANTTAGPGRGGGIWDPHGRPLARTGADQPSVIFADIERCAGR
jgi:predicted amidohydrolase